MVATSKEEIDQQHAFAERLVLEGLECMSMVDRGEISLDWKQQPTIEQVHSNATCTDPRDHGWCISSRGIVDVSKLANLIQEGLNDNAAPPPSSPAEGKKQLALLRDASRTQVKSITNLWDEANACQNNVHITRPSHDAWGIKKIALIFCDDFLQTVYELPWWYDFPDMKSSIQPILDLLQIPIHRIVRMLFASLPPGVTIPVHHDSGYWVKFSHRVHIPIIVANPDKVLFRCGPTDECMDRVSCIPGHVFEMNNQARHAVSNCDPIFHRAHLILDYVDESFTIRNGRIRLSPGEVLLQTRRSIDRALDVGTRPTPSFLILGAQKAGTTSLYEYLIQHPLVIPAKRRETHCLDWRWDESLDSTSKRKNHCLSFFHAKELRYHPSCITGESTPSYLLNSLRCIPRLKEVFPHDMKFIVMLRDPVRRAQSHYEMVTSLDGTPEQKKNRGTEWTSLSLHQVVSLDFKNMKEVGLIPYWDVENGLVHDHDLFHRFVGSVEEDEAFQRYQQKFIPLNSGSHSLVVRGMYELQLRPWMTAFPAESFLLIKLEDMAQADGVHNVVMKTFEHLELPPVEIEDMSAKNTRTYEQMTDETRDYLRRFYDPHNKRLSELLGREWEDPWSYAALSSDLDHLQ
jgi:hypothetical protein